MKVLVIDVAAAAEKLDLIELLLTVMGAPQWHGRNLDALDESVAYGGNDTVEPPYSVKFINAGNLSPDLKHELERIKEIFTDARNHEGRQVSCQIEN